MKSAPICYIDHKTGDTDHMNAHIQTEKCKKPEREPVKCKWDCGCWRCQ